MSTVPTASRRRRLIGYALAAIAGVALFVLIDSNQLAGKKDVAAQAWTDVVSAYLNRQRTVIDLIDLGQKQAPNEPALLDPLFDSLHATTNPLPPYGKDLGPETAAYEQRERTLEQVSRETMDKLAAALPAAAAPDLARIRTEFESRTVDIVELRPAVFAAIDDYNDTLGGLPTALWAWASDYRPIGGISPDGGPVVQR